jgi:hypothetical protein
MENDQDIKNAKSVGELFEIVKAIVKKYTGLDQAGLMVGLSDLGLHPKGFVGAYYSLHANMIVINKRPLKRVMQKTPQFFSYYIFHLLLHEYIHAIGYHDEMHTRQMVFEISKDSFGPQHPLTKMAFNLEPFAKNIIYANGFEPPKDMRIDFVPGIDRNNTRYIY